ncbi:MAG: OmpH family outer membrane protein [Bacteroidota bacterium]
MRYLLLTVALLATALTLSAQQYGHCNFGQLLASMPQTEVAEKQLQTFNDQLVAEGETKAKALQEKIAEYMTRKNSGIISPVQQQQEEAVLNKEREAILLLEQQLGQKVEQKRQALLGPVIERATNAIEEVAKEKGYLLIFDTSVFNSVLYGDDSVDIMADVKAKLGI